MPCRAMIIVVGTATAVLLGCDDPQIKHEQTETQIWSLESYLGKYRSDVGMYPTTEQGLQALRVQPSDLAEPSKWKGPYVRVNIPNDVWGNPYVYRRITDDQFELYSCGRDGEDGTDDDVGREIRKGE